MIRQRIFTAILFLWSGLFAFLWTGTGFAASYGDGQAVRFPNVLSAAQLAALAQQKIEEQLAAVGETRRHEVHLQHRAGTMRLPAGEVTAVVAFPRGVPYGREFPAAITVYVDGVLQRRAACYYLVTVYDRVLVAMTDIRMDEEITPANAHVEESAVDTLPETTITDFDRLAGRVAGRYIRKGAVITPTLLAMPRVLIAGSPVTLVAESGGITIRAEGVALEAGRIGYVIRVRNARSGKMMRGRVIDEKTVQIIA